MFLFQSGYRSFTHFCTFAFTFHYVSISIKGTLISDINFLTLFTFHYVSISITYRWVEMSHIDIYIPLCFYFNDSYFDSFGYAVRHLHSIMFLFQSVPCFPALHRSYSITFCRPRLLLISCFVFSILSLCKVCLFPYFFCIFRILSTFGILEAIRDRQSEQKVCCIIGFSPKFFVHPLFLSAFKDDD